MLPEHERFSLFSLCTYSTFPRRPRYPDGWPWDLSPGFLFLSGVMGPCRRMNGHESSGCRICKICALGFLRAFYFLLSLFFFPRICVKHGASRDLESAFTSLDIPMLFHSFAGRSNGCSRQAASLLNQKKVPLPSLIRRLMGMASTTPDD